MNYWWSELISLNGYVFTESYLEIFQCLMCLVV